MSISIHMTDDDFTRVCLSMTTTINVLEEQRSESHNTHQRMRLEEMINEFINTKNQIIAHTRNNA